MQSVASNRKWNGLTLDVGKRAGDCLKPAHWFGSHSPHRRHDGLHPCSFLSGGKQHDMALTQTSGQMRERGKINK